MSFSKFSPIPARTLRNAMRVQCTTLSKLPCTSRANVGCSFPNHQNLCDLPSACSRNMNRIHLCTMAQALLCSLGRQSTVAPLPKTRLDDARHVHLPCRCDSMCDRHGPNAAQDNGHLPLDNAAVMEQVWICATHEASHLSPLLLSIPCTRRTCPHTNARLYCSHT